MGVTSFLRPDQQRIGSGHVMLIPIWCLRSIQGKVHPEMTFTSGENTRTNQQVVLGCAINELLQGQQSINNFMLCFLLVLCAPRTPHCKFN